MDTTTEPELVIDLDATPRAEPEHPEQEPAEQESAGGSRPRYRRVLLKLSGEVFGAGSLGVDPDVVAPRASAGTGASCGVASRSMTSSGSVVVSTLASPLGTGPARPLLPCRPRAASVPQAGGVRRERRPDPTLPAQCRARRSGAAPVGHGAAPATVRRRP